MRYYVEINGESSLNIQGLMIQSLPSISKPLMRSKQETIDGRDGDIVTKLGYSAYDKTLKIGLWGNYDINEVIAFFNQEGTITFSNEPDKYYRFTILNRDDYVSQLDKFRTCTIALHCQPYKYKLNEEPEELENEYVEQEGTSLTFNNTLVAPMNIDLKGNTSQNGTPTPSSPIPINNVSGDNQINVVGKNIWIATLTNNGSNISPTNCTATLSGDEYTFTATGSDMQFGQIAPANNNYANSLGTLYEVSNASSIGILLTNTNFTRNYITFYNSNKVSLGYTRIDSNTGSVNVPSGATYFSWRIGLLGATSGTQYKTKIMVSYNEEPTTYEAYNGTTYNIDLPVENLFDKDNMNTLNAYINTSGVVVQDTQPSTLYIPCKPNTTYTITKPLQTTQSGNRYRYGCCSSIPAVQTQLSKFVALSGETTETIQTFTTDSTAQYLVLNYAGGNLSEYQDVINGLQIEYGSKKNTYTPYGTTPIELNKIGTYQDYFYKENDKWYLHKEIGKVVLDGTTNSFTNRYTTNTNNYYRHVWENSSVKNQPGGTIANAYCNKLSPVSIGSTYGCNQGVSINDINHRIIMYITDIREMTIEQANQWLKTNNIIVYYLIDTPTNTEITYQPLINQLNAIFEAQSKEGTTNVNQVNNDLPFILDLSVLSGTDSITLTNEGNTTSKPTLTITGSGVVGVYLENIQMFNISLGTNETIIIDTENMEAYYGSQLKNRQVTGDYSNFALQSGTNNLKFTGVVTNVEITNYNRWI